MLEPIQIEAMDPDTILGSLRYRLDSLMAIDPDHDQERITEPLIHEVSMLFGELDKRLRAGSSGLPSDWAKGLGRRMERHALAEHEEYVRRRAQSADPSWREIRTIKARIGPAEPAFKPSAP